MAEAKLIEKIKRGETDVIKFYLKTQCKDRGYTEKIEHEVINNPDKDLQNLRLFEGEMIGNLNQPVPSEIKEVFTLGVANLQRRKEYLAGIITANQANIFSKDELMTKNVRDLEGMMLIGGMVLTENDLMAPAMPKVFDLQSR